MLSSKEVASLLTALDDHSNSFENVAMGFSRLFPKTDYFRVASSLFLLLQNRVLSLGSRLNSYYILYDLYKSEPLPSNPFFPSFWLPHQIPNLPKPERMFLLVLLNNMGHTLSKRNAAECITNLELPSIPNVDLRSLIKAYQIRQPSVISAFSRMGITPPVIDDPEDLSLFKNSDFSMERDVARQDVLNKLLSSEIFEPRYLRPPPPLLAPSSNELLWLNPEEQRVPLWIQVNDGKKLLNRAINETLTPELTDLACQSIQNNHQNALELFTPSNLPNIVENNPLIAVTFLVKISSLPSSKGYFSSLASMSTTQHSMEVVNKLTTSIDLPNDFLHTYISNSITACQNCKDKAQQNRMIRFVCVFLQNLLKNKINIKPLYSVIQSFCVENSNNKEATTLFKLLKES